MPVITLSPQLLIQACSQLSHRVLASGCTPSLLVGIRQGGAEVARLMRADFPEADYCEVQLSRPDTKQKGEGWTHRLLQRLPLWICDALRIVESRISEWHSRGTTPTRIGEIRLPAEIARMLDEATTAAKGGTAPVVLLIDDAIDTGATIWQARRQLLEQHPRLDIRVAVITVTTKQPMCDADYCLYHNRTLCRFPWSNDYRGQ